MKRFFSLILVFVLMLCLISCKPDGSEKTDDPTVEIARNMAVYHNTVFYYDSRTQTIKYQNIDHIYSTGVPLYQDALASGDENPFVEMIQPKIIVDPIATEKNGGHPVLYIYYRKQLKTFLVSFNTANNQVRILKEDISPVMTLFLYGEHLIFSTAEGDAGEVIHTVKTDGTDFCTLENPDKLLMRPRNVLNDRIYFTSTGNLYTAPLSLDSSSLVLSDCDTPVFFGGEDIYYVESSTSHLCKVSPDDPSSKETVIQENTGGMAWGSLYLYLIGKPEDQNTFYLYNAQTNENKIIYQNPDPNFRRGHVCFSDTYICFQGSTDEGKRIFYYDLVKQEEIEIPY